MSELSGKRVERGRPSYCDQAPAAQAHGQSTLTRTRTRTRTRTATERRERPMGSVEIVLALVVVATVVATAAGRLSAPPPSLLVLAGLGIGLVPGLPPVRLSPDIVTLPTARCCSCWPSASASSPWWYTA